MKVSGKKLTTPLDTAVLAMGILAGCGSTTTKTAATGTTASATTVETITEVSAMTGETKDQIATEAENTPSADLSGATSMAGSASMEKFVSTLSESFMEKYPNVMMTAEFVGSGTGIETVSNGTADTGSSSRNLKDEEKTGSVVGNVVAIGGIAVVADGANMAEDLTKRQLSDIYERKVANWKDAGGNDAPIVVIGHESGSGTRNAFEELLKLEDTCKYSNELDSIGAVTAKVVSTPGVVGHVSLGVLDDTVRAVKLKGVEPTKKGIKAGSYFLNRPSMMAVKGSISEQNELVKTLFDYTYSDEGVEVVESIGLIAVDKQSEQRKKTSCMETETFSIRSSHGSKSAVEEAAQGISTICGFFAVLAIASTTLYMLISGTSALFKVGLPGILFGTTWQPAATSPSFGILLAILTSIVETFLVILIGIPIGVMTATFLAEVAPERLSDMARPAVELLAGIPSIIYDLLRILTLNPLIYKVELILFKGSETHQSTGGTNPISIALVLALTILPTVTSISESALRPVLTYLKSTSLALDATKIQTILQVIVPAARSGIITVVVLRTGRAIDEAMAISFAPGSSVNLSLPLNSVRFLTAAITSEMGYVTGLYKQTLFTISLVLFALIMIINISLIRILKKEGNRNDK